MCDGTNPFAFEFHIKNFLVESGPSGFDFKGNRYAPTSAGDINSPQSLGVYKCNPWLRVIDTDTDTSDCPCTGRARGGRSAPARGALGARRHAARCAAVGALPRRAAQPSPRSQRGGRGVLRGQSARVGGGDDRGPVVRIVFA